MGLFYKVKYDDAEKREDIEIMKNVNKIVKDENNLALKYTGEAMRKLHDSSTKALLLHSSSELDRSNYNTAKFTAPQKLLNLPNEPLNAGKKWENTTKPTR